MNKAWQIVLKEWQEIFKNKIVFYVVVLVPIILTILPLVILFQMKDSGELGQAVAGAGTEDLPANMAALCEGLSSSICTQYFVISQFIQLFLILPVMIPATIAAYSIVGEKSTRTLEPLLATPVTTLELLLGKSLSAVIPAVLVTWLSFGFFIGGTALIMDSTELIRLILSPMWLVLVFVAAPLLSVLGVSVAVMVSSRVTDPRVAEQISMLVILPIIALTMAQSFGAIQMNLTATIWIVAILLIIDIVLLYLATQLFQRETILTKWK